MLLIWPAVPHLPSYIHALRQGWSPDTLRPEAGAEELERIELDRDRFIAEQIDRDATGPAILLPDGSAVPRLPGYRMWMWDGDFCGVIGFRWQPGTTELPPYCLGHVGFSVVPWKRQRGYATRALQLLLPRAAEEGMPFVELTTAAANTASRRVIEANGGQLVEKFRKAGVFGGAESLRFRIALNGQALPAAPA